MATYLDGMKGGKHNSDDAEASFYPKPKKKTTSLLDQIAEIAKPKFCGDTSVIISARVKITGFKGDDAEMNGLTGTTTHPFPFGYNTKGMIGIYLDAGQKKVSTKGDRINVEADKVFFLPTEDYLAYMNLFKQ